jgi:flavin reductase (DIM6/NTAB) family NADH-FMN oxidoreductase RutF
VSFTKLVAQLDYPMFVVTTVAADDGERSGCLVGFTSQCSIKPPRFLVLISEKNHTHGVMLRAEHVAVHLVADRGLAEHFGSETGDEVDKFTDCSWRPGPGGVPLLDGATAWFAGPVVDRLSALGDHLGVVVDPAEVSDHVGTTLTFQQLKDVDPGHEP